MLRRLIRQPQQRTLSSLSSVHRTRNLNGLNPQQQQQQQHVVPLAQQQQHQLQQRANHMEASKMAKTTALPARNPLFDKILIANRGEIACRIIQTARRLGIRTVAVFSEADRNAMHVQMADEAYWIGEAESSKSYLRAEHLLEVAKKAGAQAIHPGYGFLSENANFAQLCTNNGIAFIGPPPSAIQSMGSKSESKKIMEKANVPVVPGYHGDNQDEHLLLEEAKKIEFPVLIKAVMGGGGKGMRIVNQESEFLDALHSAKQEAISSFGDDRVIIEKYITQPRHIEFQVFGDRHGNYVHLYERDCSVQRRHQKIIEEAPAPDMTKELRDRMGKSAVDAARAVNYQGAGTVEFIVDATDPNKYFFMEMNTRLQVEHPVSEMITGQDLVEWQLQVASGNELPVKEQSQLSINGHAFETRIYAENPDKEFMPGTGTLTYLKTPQEEPNSVRVDTGVRQNDEVSIYYDPMIAKLIVRGEDRGVALKKLKAALDQYHIAGLQTNIEFLKRLSLHPEFRKGNVDTNFIPSNYDQLFPKDQTTSDEFYVLGAVSLVLKEQSERMQNQMNNNPLGDVHSPFGTLKGTRFGYELEAVVQFESKDDQSTVPVTIRFERDAKNTNDRFSHFVVTIGDKHLKVKATHEGNHVLAYIGTEKHTADVVLDGKNVTLFTQTVDDGASKTLTLKQTPIAGAGSDALGEGKLKSPMPGKVVKILCEVSQGVEKGQPLIVVEAMKMMHTIHAPMSGKVKEVMKAEGQLVGFEETLIVVDAAEH